MPMLRRASTELREPTMLDGGGVQIVLDTKEGQSTLILFSGDFSFDETKAVRYIAMENEATRYLAYIA